MFLIYTSSIAISCLVSIGLYFRNSNELYFKLFFPFLLTTTVVETTAWWMFSKRIPNHYLYNFFMIIEFAFYFFVLHQVIKSIRARKIISIIGWIFPAIAGLNVVKNGVGGFQFITYLLGALLIVAFCIFYFYELFKFPVPKIHLDPSFWICFGLLLFYSTTSTLTGVYVTFPLSPNLNNLIPLFIRVMNCVFYTMFTIGFLCKIKKDFHYPKKKI
jgi:hypothetical protein